MTKITKGVPVYLFLNANQHGTFIFRKCVVKSAGKIRMTLESEVAGKMIKSFVYAHDYDSVIAIADMPDPVAHALQLGVENRQHMIALNMSKLDHPAYCREGVEEALTKLHASTPRGVSYEVWTEEADARFAKYLASRN